MSGYHERLTRRGVLQLGGATVAASIAAPLIAQTQNPIRVGVLQPFTGGLEALGQQGARGAELALLNANDSGGINGRMFEIVRSDTATDPKTAVERTNELIRRHEVSAIIGPVTSANRDAMRPTIERAKMPLLYATDYEGGVCSKYITCYSALPDHWVVPLVDHAVKNIGNKFFLVGSDYVWPRQMNAAFANECEKLSASVVGEEYTPWGAKDYTATLRKIQDSGASAVAITIAGADAVTFVKQFVAAGMKDDIRIIFFGFSENYLSGLTESESEGIIAPSNFIASLESPGAQELNRLVRTRFGDDAIVSNTVDAHWTLTRMYIEGIRRAGTDEKDAVLDAMVDQTIRSGNGEVYLRPEDRHVDLNVLIAEVRGGELHVLKDLGRISAANQCA
ncbi:aliphatic amidase expression-regulating protein [Roseovarius sp. TE539]|uniref:substrate-binding protein n=1 Tax=Roseovarius sp. TE539 TaxID=2249812 RepID=UPI000DE19D0F|nr:substrate-binding protein [Roseovarius sp. TE539]RBI68393.1 aliphatic amidase expression-regulating protein [Roseovarius sp. TE539]